MKKVQLIIRKNNQRQAFTLVEILVALSIFLLFVTAIINVSVNSSKQSRRATNNERASEIAKEGIEAVRNIRDEDFANLVDGTYGLSTTSNQWNLIGSSDQVGIFNREITIETVSANIKKITANVSWDDQSALNNQVSIATHLTNWQYFMPPAGFTLKKVIVNYFSSTTASDFADYTITPVGTTTGQILDVNTAVESPSGTFTFETVQLLPGDYNVQEQVDSNYTQTFSDDCDISGNITLTPSGSHICTITNEEKYANLTLTKTVVNNGGSKTESDFAPYYYGATTIPLNIATKIPVGTHIISETADPDYTISFGGDCDGGGSVTVVENDNKNCSITNTQATWANPNTSQGTLDLSGTQDGRKVQVSGNYAYIVRAGGTPDFVIVNISDSANPILTGSLNLSGNPSNIFVSGNYAYVSSDDNAQELQIINISDPSNPSIAATFDAVSNNNANTVFVSGNYAYLGRANTGIEQDFVVINVTNPTLPTLTTSLNTGATTYEIVVSGNYAYIASGADSSELRVVDITNPAVPAIFGIGYNAPTNTDAITVAVSGNIALIGQGSNLRKINITNPAVPTLSGTYTAGGTINDISIWDSALYAFLATANTTAEMTVINISPATPTLIGNFNASATFNGVAYDSARNRAIMVGTTDASELQIIRP